MLDLIFRIADPEVIEKRRKICEECPMRKWNDIFSLWACGTFLIRHTKKKIPMNERSCGCIIEEKTKLKKFKCPQRKW